MSGLTLKDIQVKLELMDETNPRAVGRLQSVGMRAAEVGVDSIMTAETQLLETQATACTAGESLKDFLSLKDLLCGDVHVSALRTFFVVMSCWCLFAG